MNDVDPTTQLPMQPNDDEQILVLQAKWTLGLLPSEDVPTLCLDLLSAGYDTQTLRILAGLPSVELDEVPELLPRLFREFDLRHHASPEQAPRSIN